MSHTAHVYTPLRLILATDFPSALICVCGHRTCHTPHPAHRRDGAFQRAMDTAIAACSDPV
jgi:hypothetical protein